MEFNEFRKMICEKMKKCLGEGYQVTECDTEKINGIVKQGISIRNKRENIGTICYLKELYEEFLKGMISDTGIIELLRDMISNDTYTEKIENNISYVKDWKKVKELVRVRLINTAKNTEMLKNRAHMNLLDLSIIFYLELPAEKEVVAGIAVTNEMMKAWGENETSLLKQAKKNIESEGIYLINARTAEEWEIFGQDDTIMKDISEFEIYALTRKNVTYGAAVILSPYIRKRLCEIYDEGVYILPSSTHELLLVSKKICDNVKILEDMVKFGNATAIEAEEYLGNKVYTLDDEFQLKYVV